MQFIYSTYPCGSFDDRPLNFSDISATLSIRKFLLNRIFETFPQRKFVLVADTSNSDVMRDYPAMATDFPGQVQCIFLRNTTATDPGDRYASLLHSFGLRAHHLLIPACLGSHTTPPASRTSTKTPTCSSSTPMTSPTWTSPTATATTSPSPRTSPSGTRACRSALVARRR